MNWLPIVFGVLLSAGFAVSAFAQISPLTAEDLKNEYKNASLLPASETKAKVRVLIVPGHEPDFGGTVFRLSHERDIVVPIAEKLAAYLRQNPRYDVVVSRTQSAWHPILKEYFTNHWERIASFRDGQSKDMAWKLSVGSVVPLADQVPHNSARQDVALRLYGINKWATENDIDVTLHLHLNDEGGRPENYPGEFGGFALYVPDQHYASAGASRAVAWAVASRLNTYHATSSAPTESAGVIEDQDLIAVGSNNSIDSASVLIEYGYIYEPQFGNGDTIGLAAKDYAFQTYLGLQDFFEDSAASPYGSAVLPYIWTASPPKNKTTPEAYALQSALRHLGFYPAKGRSFDDCPISGRFGPCTEQAVKEFQKAKGIEPLGIVGPKTRAVLHSALK